MSRTKSRGFFLFAAALSLMNVAVANDPFSFASPTAEFGVAKFEGKRGSQLSSDSIDRYMHNNALAPAVAENAAYEEDAAAVASTGWRLSKDTAMIAVIGVCVALGVVLCLTGVVLTRKPAFSGGRGGLVRIC